MGRVYLGHHEALDLPVAVNVMRDPDGDTERFLAEARLAVRIRHDHMGHIHHAGQENGRLFLVMEYASGSKLKQLVMQKGPLPWGKAAGYILPAARGLAATQRAGSIHRDVKPSNMLLTSYDMVRLSDLGIARDSTSLSHDPSVGKSVGTPAFLAPEQIKAAHYAGPSADVSALGGNFYSLLTSKKTFPRKHSANVLVAHLTEPVPDIRQRIPGLPQEFVDLLQGMLSKDPAAHPHDDTAMVIELERRLGLGARRKYATHQPRHAPSWGVQL